MPRVTLIPNGKFIEVEKGSNLLDACQKLGLKVNVSCGGKGICRKCLVKVTSGTVSDKPSLSHGMPKEDINTGWRYACISQIDEDIQILESSTAQEKTIVLTDFKTKIPPLDDCILLIESNILETSLDNQIDLVSKIEKSVGYKFKVTNQIKFLDKIDQKISRLDTSAYLFIDKKIIKQIVSAKHSPKILGLAIDIGTTTIAGVLCDMLTGDIIAVVSNENPQSLRGDDVISRIEYASRGEAEKKEMQQLIVTAINDLLANCCQIAKVDQDNIVRISICANTTMHHLLLNLNSKVLATNPFIPILSKSLIINAEDINIDSTAELYCLPNISAYVGGDIVAGIIAYDIYKEQGNILLLDVGTNGEIVLKTQNAIYSCATAAGPAFEGARIDQGMRAIAGAINTAKVINNDLAITTIGNKPAIGICGTGLIDLVAVFLELGVIDETGKIKSPEELNTEGNKISKKILSRIKHTEKSLSLLVSTDNNQEIYLTQKDIREFQLAKGAIAAGIKILTNVSGIKLENIDKVLLAGGFGNYLLAETALKTGLIPKDINKEKIISVGNAALAGARLCLLSQQERDIAENIISKVKYVELSNCEDFSIVFTEEMLF